MTISANLTPGFALAAICAIGPEKNANASHFSGDGPQQNWALDCRRTILLSSQNSVVSNAIACTFQRGAEQGFPGMAHREKRGASRAFRCRARTQIGIVTIRGRRRASTSIRHTRIRVALTHAAMLLLHRNPLAPDERHAICGSCTHAVGLRNRIDITRYRSKVSAMYRQRRTTCSARRYARVDRTDRVRIDVLSAKNSHALSHLRIVFFDTHRAERASSRTMSANARDARASDHEGRARNIVCCCKPA